MSSTLFNCLGPLLTAEWDHTKTINYPLPCSVFTCSDVWTSDTSSASSVWSWVCWWGMKTSRHLNSTPRDNSPRRNWNIKNTIYCDVRFNGDLRSPLSPASCDPSPAVWMTAEELMWQSSTNTTNTTICPTRRHPAIAARAVCSQRTFTKFHSAPTRAFSLLKASTGTMLNRRYKYDKYICDIGMLIHKDYNWQLFG